MKRRISAFIATLVAGMALGSSPVFALKDGQVLTPPMGWSSWNYFKCSDQIGRDRISMKLILDMARAMKKSGMQDAGYQYVNVDDCWGKFNRDDNGGLVALDVFPGGMKALADSIHSMGFKFGLYTDLFEKTCAYWFNTPKYTLGLPGLWGNEKRDADSLVKWGVDFLKVDYCGAIKYDQVNGGKPHPEFLGVGSSDPVEREKGKQATIMRYRMVRDSLTKAVADAKKNGQVNAHFPVYSICEQGRNEPWLWGDSIGHLWRTQLDISPKFSDFIGQILTIISLGKHSGPGGWNDPDMLEVGNLVEAGRPLVNEDRVHMALWCAMSAPLVAGNDLRNMSDATTKLLINKDAIAINQDSLGLQGVAISGDNTSEMRIAKKMRFGNFAVVLVNRSTSPRDLSITWQEIATATGVPLQDSVSFNVKDVFGGTELGVKQGSYIAKAVPVRDVVFLKMTRVNPIADIKIPMIAEKHYPKLSFKNAQGGLSARFEGNEAFSISVFNLKGKLIGTKSIKGSGDYSISTKQNSSGIYLVKVKINGIAYNYRILVHNQ